MTQAHFYPYPFLLYLLTRHCTLLSPSHALMVVVSLTYPEKAFLSIRSTSGFSVVVFPFSFTFVYLSHSFYNSFLFFSFLSFSLPSFLFSFEVSPIGFSISFCSGFLRGFLYTIRIRFPLSFFLEEKLYFTYTFMYIYRSICIRLCIRLCRSICIRFRNASVFVSPSLTLLYNWFPNGFRSLIGNFKGNTLQFFQTLLENFTTYKISGKFFGKISGKFPRKF